MAARAWAAVAVVMAGAALAQTAASDISTEIGMVLVRDLRFSAAELADLQRGKVVKHGIATSAPGEIAAVGAVRVNTSKAAFLDRVRDIVRFKRGPDILQIGRFGNPPSLDDLAALTVDKDDFDVRACRVGDCSGRLPADVIRRFR